MNERIKALADQCHHPYSEHRIDLKKFAELLIKECMYVAKLTNPSDGADYRSGRYWAGIDIKKHFGVEE